MRSGTEVPEVQQGSLGMVLLTGIPRTAMFMKVTLALQHWHHFLKNHQVPNVARMRSSSASKSPALAGKWHQSPAASLIRILGGVAVSRNVPPLPLQRRRSVGNFSAGNPKRARGASKSLWDFRPPYRCSECKDFLRNSKGSAAQDAVGKFTAGLLGILGLPPYGWSKCKGSLGTTRILEPRMLWGSFKRGTLRPWGTLRP